MFKTNIKLFEVHFPQIQPKTLTAMIIGGCNAYIGEYVSEENDIYSEWEENNYAYLNMNGHGGKVFELEICLQSNQENIYTEFYARCFSIRTDSGLRIKENGFKNDKHVTKMNMYNQAVLGVGLYLEKMEYALLIEAKEILLEGFFALKKVNNTYGIVVKIVKHDGKYEVQFANTYKIKEIRNINDLSH